MADEPKLTSPELVRYARELLETAEWGYRDLTGTVPERRPHGLRAAIVFGRAVTIALQHMSSREPEFNAWYAPWQARFAGDSEYQRLNAMRNDVLKTAAFKVGVTIAAPTIRVGEDGESGTDGEGTASITIAVEDNFIEAAPLIRRYLDELQQCVAEAAAKFV